jgi:hypothetical protein
VTHTPKSMPALCRFRDALGVPGRGVHRARVPGTPSAAFDYAGTLGLAWATSALTGVRLSVTTIAWFAVAELLHLAFCVRVPGAARDTA